METAFGRAAAARCGSGEVISLSHSQAETGKIRGATHRRAAYYVDKVLKGASRPELPVEQPNKFELVINLNTAKQIGLTIPVRVLERANRVIK